MLSTMAAYVGTDVWVVGLEPSCTAALRADLPALFPGDAVAEWLAARIFTFAEALDRLADPAWAPQVNRRTISQTHCHQHAVLGTDSDVRVMGRLAIDNVALDSGCCGLAGDFGFERRHLDVSLAVAERGLLPAVRAAPPDTDVLADGFSCRTQLLHTVERQSLHLAQLIDKAIASVPDRHT